MTLVLSSKFTAKTIDNNKIQWYTMKRGETMYKVSANGYSRREAAKYLNIAVSTLHRWEKNGVATPKRNNVGNPYYTEEQLQELKEKMK